MQVEDAEDSFGGSLTNPFDDAFFFIVHVIGTCYQSGNNGTKEQLKDSFLVDSDLDRICDVLWGSRRRFVVGNVWEFA